MSVHESPADVMMRELHTSFNTIIKEFANSTNSIISGDTDIGLEVSPMGGKLYFEITLGCMLSRNAETDEHKNACAPHLKLL